MLNLSNYKQIKKKKDKEKRFFNLYYTLVPCMFRSIQLLMVNHEIH